MWKWWCRDMDFLDLWEEMASRVQIKELEEVAVILKRIWFRMNQFVLQLKFINPITMFRAAKQELSNFHSTEQITHPDNHAKGRVKRLVKWKKLYLNFYKANWDACFDGKTNKVGGGVVIQDSQGKMIVVVCFNEEFVVSPFIAKIKVLWRTLLFC